MFDDQLHVIHKFTYDGKLVMTLGTKGQRGRDAGRLFDRPTDIAWLPDGTFFITDGYGGTRVAKFDKDGTFLMDWGAAAEGPEATPGPTSGTPCTASPSATTGGCSSSTAVIAACRCSTSTASSSTCGRTGVRSSPYAHFISTDQFLWVADGGTMRMLKYDLNGTLPLRLGRAGWAAGPVQRRRTP